MADLLDLSGESMNKWEKYLASKRGLCSGCGKVHYLAKRNQPGSRQNTLRLTKKGWWAADLMRRNDAK